MSEYEIETLLPDGSRVLRTKTFCLILRPGENDQLEIDKMVERLKPPKPKPRVPGPYSDT